MAATVEWLPPLNSHRNYVINVRIREHGLPEQYHVEGKVNLNLAADVDVVFYSEADVSMQTAVRGLSLWKRVVIDATTQETLAASLRAHLLADRQFIPFPLDSCWLTEEHRSLPLRLFGGSDELVQRIIGFVGNYRPAGVQLAIKKTVRVPAEEFATWIRWKAEQKRADPIFELNYTRAFMNRRAEEQRRPGNRSAVEAAGMGEEGCCMICLEKFADGSGGVGRLPCRHRFHEECIIKWLEGNVVCPVCRHQLPDADHDTIINRTGSTWVGQGPTHTARVRVRLLPRPFVKWVSIYFGLGLRWI